jgi:hypothetical protein
MEVQRGMYNFIILLHLRFELFSAVTMKNSLVGCDAVWLLLEPTLLVTVKVVPRSLFLSTVMMVAVRFSETPVLTLATRHQIREDGILHFTSFSHTERHSVVASVLGLLNSSRGSSLCRIPLS